MACENTILTRYRVRIRQEAGDPLPGKALIANGYVFLTQIVKVGELDAGKWGTVELRERTKTFRVNNRERALQPLTFDFKLEGSLSAGLLEELFVSWHANPGIVCDVMVDICDRSWCCLQVWEYRGCTMTTFKAAGGQEMGKGQMGIYTCEVEPYEVSLKIGLDAVGAGIALTRT